MNHSDTRTLSDLGERQLVQEVLAARYGSTSSNFGDDCAALPPAPAGAVLVATTDPCPPPMAHALGYHDEYYRGWLLATINLSDLAAAGAKPLGLMTSLVLPANASVSDFERLLDGVDACSEAEGTVVLGGNLKEGETVDVAATAVGYVGNGVPLSRRGACPGDCVIAIGELGAFWAGALTVRGGVSLDPADPLLKNVLRPVPKTRVANELNERRLLTCAMDNSDGVGPSLLQLAIASGVRFLVNLDEWEFGSAVDEACAALGVRGARLALGWGDWQLIACCRPQSLHAIADTARRHATGMHVLGEVVEGAGVVARDLGEEGYLNVAESERFRPESWFASGLDGYIERLLCAPLTAT